jgi:hypothetical protein
MQFGRNMNARNLVRGSNQSISDREKKWRAREIRKCRTNPLYFIHNYCFLDEGGGQVLYKKELMHNKIRRVVRSIYKFKKAILMASRQLGKSTIAACMVAWAMVFFPRNKAVILNMKQNAGKKNLSMIKFIIKNLPVWMVTDRPFKNKSDAVTYCELFNDSRIDVFYPATTHDPSTLARSLTVAVLYIDESAFIKYMEEIYGSAQQTLSKAREQAKKYGYPYFMLVTSTPNGTQGDGEWFYQRWGNAVESDDLFVLNEETGLEDWNEDIDVEEAVRDPNKNTFVRVRYHWSEDPSKSQEWYQEQCQELDDQRKINQELDLLFVGTSQCIFDDDILASFKAQKPVIAMPCPHHSKLEIYTHELDPTDWYIIGCDTAQSLTGNWCALQIFGFREFNQIGELANKFGSYYNYGEAIHYVFQWLYSQVGDRIILSIENNTIGQAPIEYLTKSVTTFNYIPYLDKDVDKSGNLKDELGVKTTGLTKSLMVGCLVETINENISGFKSQNLINQFGAIEKTASGTFKSSTSTDLFMAACFCAYTRKRRAMEILPQIQFSNIQLQNQVYNTVKTAASVASTKKYIEFKDKMNTILGADEDYDQQFSSSDDTFDSSFLPFFNG